MLQRKSRVSYDTNYNVLTDEFSVSIVHDQINGEVGKDRYDTYSVSLEGNVLSEKYNGVEIRINLCTNEKTLIVDDSRANSQLALLTMEEIENEIMRMVKSIKGEIPLPGLVERIDNYLELMTDEFTVKEPGNPSLALVV